MFLGGSFLKLADDNKYIMNQKIKKKLTGLAGGSKKVKIWPRMGLAFIYFWPRSLLEAPKCVKDP